MHWIDETIVLSAKKHGETSAVARLFSQTHGVYGGIVRGIHSKANRGVIQPGNIVSATWQARLPEHMGTFKCELLQSHAALLMQDAPRLAALDAACAVLTASLPERHPYPKLYKEFREFLEELQNTDDWPQAYVRLEMDLLAEAGFGLDLSQCAATGTTEDLIYVSPKSGRAVSREAAEPYKEKLLALPGFLLSPSLTLPRFAGEGTAPERQEILAGLTLTGYFLDSWLLSPHNRRLPAARERWIEIMREYSIKKKEPHGAEAG